MQVPWEAASSSWTLKFVVKLLVWGLDPQLFSRFDSCTGELGAEHTKVRTNSKKPTQKRHDAVLPSLTIDLQRMTAAVSLPLTKLPTCFFRITPKGGL